MNLGRFIAKDVLSADLSLDVEGMLNISPQPDRGLDPTLAPNYLEQLLALLALPTPAREAVKGRKCGNLTLATRLMLDRNYGSGQFRPAPVLTRSSRTPTSARRMPSSMNWLTSTPQPGICQASATSAQPFGIRTAATRHEAG